jgi:hypothetical protein
MITSNPVGYQRNLLDEVRRRRRALLRIGTPIARPDA